MKMGNECFVFCAKFFVFAISVLLLSGPVNAQRKIATGGTHFYVSSAGVDSGNDCLNGGTPCRTMQTAADHIIKDWDFAGSTPFIQLIDGVIDNALNLWERPIGFHFVKVQGRLGNDCNESAVTVRPPSNTPAFWVQDGNTLVVECLTVTGDAPTDAFVCRQFSILDVDRIKYGVLRSALKADDQCGINVGGFARIGGDLAVWASANNLSRMLVTGPVTFLHEVKIGIAFAVSYSQSLIKFKEGSTIENGSFVKGQKYRVYQGGTLSTNGLTMPGTIPGDNISGSVF
jgi:hypothetical protein